MLKLQMLLLMGAFALTTAGTAFAEPQVFEGEWKTTNRKLDGPMTCEVTRLPGDAWQGRFFGVWQGVPFDYTVRFTGPAEELRGTATIDGASYEWKGVIDENSFRGGFGGSRYEGWFRLRAKPASASVTKN